MTHRPLFGSVFSAGFECSSHRRGDKRRLDLIASTKHDRFAELDYARLAAVGMETVRDGLRWHLIERARGLYDWSSWRPMLAAARSSGVRVAWDLCHYGWPDFIDIWSPKFVDALGDFAETAVKVHAQETDEPPVFCVVNEMSFFAWGGGDMGHFNPWGKGRGDELKRQLIKATIHAAARIRAVDPRAKIITAEPLIHISPPDGRPESIKAAESYRQSQFYATDVLLGLAEPEIGGSADVVDYIGLNYYPHNQWYWSGPTIPMGHHEYRPMSDMLVEVAERYIKPMFIAETGAEASGRAAWLHYVCDEVRAAVSRGAAIETICLYPILDYPGWDNDRSCQVGLFCNADEKGERGIHRPLLDEIVRQQAIFNALATPAQRPIRAAMA